MPQQHAYSDATLPGLGRAQFALNDVLRCAQGEALAALGFGPDEHPYRVVASGAHWRLRDYGADGGGPSLMIVAAPIKRPYVWDLAPSASAIGTCLGLGADVRLLEWEPATDALDIGLEQCAQAVAECVAKTTQEASGRKPFLAGHSLGGTLAAICGALEPDTVAGLVLLAAPICFAPGTSGFRDALVSIVARELIDDAPCPGSLLSQVSALASPQAFQWSRMLDAALSATDQRALETHWRVERWALDEVALPGRLAHEIVEWLYRENRYCRGTLKIGARTISPSGVTVPVLAAVTADDDIAPRASIAPFLDAVKTEDVRLVEQPNEIGACLQHLAALVARSAHERLWPEIVAWMQQRPARASSAGRAESTTSTSRASRRRGAR